MKPQRRLAALTGFNLALLGVLWLLENGVAERHWLTALLLYVPQHGAALPALGLALWAARRRAWPWLGVNVAVLAIVLFAFLGCTVPRPRAASPGVIWRVMSYNINAGSRGAAAIVAVVQAFQPDVLCLQEAAAWRRYPDPMPELKRRLPGWHLVRQGELATLSRHPISAHRVWPFPIHLGDGVLETDFAFNGHRLRVLNVHLTIPIGSPSPAVINRRIAARMSQTSVLLHATGPENRMPLLVLGNFNNPPRGLLHRRLTARFQDSFRAAGWGLGYSFATYCPVTRIDYVFADQSIAVRSCRVPNVHASDHRPVVADVTLAAP